MGLELSWKSFVFGLLGLSASTGLYVAAGSPHRQYRRQVPQEWAHASEIRTVDEMLKLNNPLRVVHPIFCLLGPDTGSKGAGKLELRFMDCFQKIVADQAFTNAKKANNQKGQEAAIIFASLERNSPALGKETVPCRSVRVYNREIQRLIQHQDAAGGPLAVENNKMSARLAALSLREIGSDPYLALRTGTFPPGDPKNPNNQAGFSCDDENDKEGCIYSKGLLVEDLTTVEIDEFLRSAGLKRRPKPNTKTR